MILVALILSLGALFLCFLAISLFLQWRSGDHQELPPLQWLTLDGEKVAYYQSGNGPDLVLIHGLGASSYCWRYLIPLLAERYRVTSVDMMGFGESSPNPDLDFTLDGQGQRLHSILSLLGLKTPVLVGSSLGGLLALWLGLNFPTHYSRLVTLAPAALGKAKGLLVPQWSWLKRWTKLYVNIWTMPWLVFFVVSSFRPISRESLKNYLRPYARQNAMSCLLSAAQAITDPRVPDIFLQLATPTLILRGRFDFLVSQKVVNRLAQVMPNAQIENLSSAHHPQEHIPQVIAAKIFAWLESSQDKNPTRL